MQFLKKNNMNTMDEFFAYISVLSEKKSHVLIAVDGCCASGKTTLADEIKRKYGGNIFHMDDFFLRPEQRTEERLQEPGGNVDRERFLDEVLIPLSDGKPLIYRRYDCKTQAFLPDETICPTAVNIIEGAYSCHPELRKYYDITAFLTVGEKEQIKRIIERNGAEQAKTFREKWIPLENRYFEAFGIKEKCDFIL